MAAPPPGIAPVYVSNSDRTRHGLGADVTHKLFAKDAMLNDIVGFAKLSLWYSFKAAIEAYPGTELLVVADPTMTYGENFFLVTREDVKSQQLEVRARHTAPAS